MPSGYVRNSPALYEDGRSVPVGSVLYVSWPTHEILNELAIPLRIRLKAFHRLCQGDSAIAYARKSCNILLKRGLRLADISKV